VADNVTNVRVRQEGKTIVVTYDIKYYSDVRLMMSSAGSSKYVELKSVTGDIGEVGSGENRQIVWSPLEEFGEFVAKGVKFKVDAIRYGKRTDKNETVRKSGLKNMKTLVAAQMGYSIAPQLSFGLMVGQTYRGIGWYVSGRSNFKERKYGNQIYDEAYLNNYFLSGNKSKSHYVVNAGLMLDFMSLSGKIKNRFNTIGMYIGGGYGQRILTLKSTPYGWYYYEPTSVESFSVDLGLFASVKRFTFNLGVNTIGFEYIDVNFGLGYMF